MTIWTIIIFIIILSVVVIIHELGHFGAARWLKVKVLEFGLGFPPLAKKLFTSKGTDFVLNWVPLGGYVNLAGEEEDPDGDKKATAPETKKNAARVAQKAARMAITAKKSQSPLETAPTTKAARMALNAARVAPADDDGQELFYRKKPWQRFVVIVAGPVSNFLLAAVIFMIVYGVLGIPEKIDKSVFIDYVEPDSPAAEAGLPAGVKIMTIQNQAGEVTVIEDMEQAIALIGANKGSRVTMTTTGQCQRGACQEIARVFEIYVRTDEEKPAGSGALGVALTQYQDFFYPWYQQVPLSIYHGGKQSVLMAQEMIMGLVKMVTDAFGSGESEVVVMGPVGIVSELDKQETFSEGLMAILQFAGLLSLNLGIINLLPIPALDGGRLVLIVLEKFIGRRRIAKVEMGLNYAGFIFIMGLAVLVTGQDIWRIIKGG